MAETDERLSFGRVVSLTFSGLKDNMAVIAPAAGILLLAPNILIGVLTPRDDAQSFGDIMGAMLMLGPAGLLAGIASIAFYVIGIRTLIDAWNGSPLTLADAFSTVKTGFLPMFGIGILAGIGLVFGFVLLIIPGLFLMTAWAVVQPVVLYERWRDLFSPFQRSMALTKGSRWTIFGLFAVLVLAAMVIGGVLGVMGIFLGPVLAGAVIEPVLNTGFALIGVAFVAALYHELVRIKEGGGRKVAEVFA